MRRLRSSKQIRPKKIRLEASSVCQLKCPTCPNSSGAMLPTVGKGFLQLADFKKLLRANRWIREIELSNFGEIFLNPDLLEIIRHAWEWKVVLTANNGVNLNKVDETVLEGLVKYRFRSITCSIDGVRGSTYRRYRIGGDLDAVIENIKKINRFKNQYRADYPVLIWQFLAFGHNEHEIPKARKLAKELGMIFFLKLPWDPAFSPLYDEKAVRKEIGAASIVEYREKYGAEYMQEICHQLWKEPQINWNGNVLGCCRNFWGDFGANAFNEGLFESLNCERMVYARDMLLGRQKERDDIPCTVCEYYLGMKARGKWLKRGVPFLFNEFRDRPKIALAFVGRTAVRRVIGACR